MRCRTCESENPEGTKFCGHCGQPLYRTCPSCGHQNPSDFKYCGECGHELEPPVSTRKDETAEGERKHITVLFSDLTGYTSLAEKLDPEEVKAIMDRLLTKVSEIIAKHEGAIEKFIGDAVVAFFGMPQSHEDDPIRAIRAAVEIHEIVAKIIGSEVQERIQRHLTMHTGINTGLVVAGKVVGEGVLRVAGDSVNVASRLCGLARPGEILVGEDTYHYTEGYFSFERLKPTRIKGKTLPITPYRVIGEAKVSGTRGLAMQGISSPLVGRNAEFTALKGCVNRLLDGQGGVVSIIGEAGMGKSRLMAEIRKDTMSNRGLTSVNWIEGHTLSYGQKISYWPFREMVRQFAGISEDDSDIEAWGKLRIQIAQLFPADSGEILPYVASLATLDIKDEYAEQIRYLDGEGRGHQIFLASRRFFERLAQMRPLILVFEDLHWIDESSILLMEHLLPLVQRVPLLLCGVSRPEAGSAAFRLREMTSKEYGRWYTEIRLDPLSQTESIELMQNLLEVINLPNHVRELIVRKAEGNPFFLEEIMRSLIDSGAVIRDARTGLWKSTSKAETVDIPDTVQGVISARLDRLNDQLKQVLRSASVIGRAFLYRILRGINEAVSRLDEQLDQLEGMELIRQKQKIPELEYIFKHALVQESTYESILLQKRRELHTQVAQVIEKLFPERLEEFYTMLAHHYMKGEVWDKAQDYLFKAGDQASQIAADSEALTHYREAMETYARVFGDKWDPVQRASLERKMLEAFYRRGEHQKALECLERALSYLGRSIPKSPRETRLAILHEIMIQICHRLFPRFLVKPPDSPASRAAEEEERIFDSIGWIDAISNRERFLWDALRKLNFAEREGLPEGTIAASYSALAVIGAILGLFRLSRRYSKMAVRVAEKAQLPEALGVAYFSLAFYEMYAGRFDRALEHGLRSADAFRRDGAWNLRGWGFAVVPVCISYLYQGNLSSAVAYAQGVARSAQEAALPQIACWALAFLGRAQVQEGRFDDAVVNLKKSIELAKGIPDHKFRLLDGAQLGICYLRQNDIERGLNTLEKCETYRIKYRMDKFIEGLATGIAHAYLLAAEQGAENEKKARLGKARGRCEHALKLGRKWPIMLAEAMRLKGTCEWLRENPVSAQAWWDRSLHLAGDMGMRYELAMTHLELGRRLKNRAHLQQAEAIFANIGAGFDLAEAARLLEAVSG